jgi:hypothetical protein
LALHFPLGYALFAPVPEHLEKLAQAFAIEWCNRLWSESFVHTDPVHNSQSPAEIASLTTEKLVFNRE